MSITSRSGMKPWSGKEGALVWGMDSSMGEREHRVSAAVVNRPIRTSRHGAALNTSAAGLILLLITAVATDRLGIHVGDFNLRLEFITGGLVAMVAVLTGRQAALCGWGLVDLCLGGWLIVNLVSSLLFSPDPLKSLKFVVLLAGLLTIYVAARLLVKSEAALVWAASAFVALGSAVALLGVVCALLFNVIGPNFGIFLEKFYRGEVLVVIPKVQSVLWEPNIYGSFLLVVCVLASALVMGQRPTRLWVRSVVPQLAIAAGVCGIVLSMTRTVWAVGPLLILLVAALASRFGLAEPRRVAVAILIPALLGGLAGLGIGLSLPAPKWNIDNPWEPTQEQIDGLVRQRLFGTIPDAKSQVPLLSSAGQSSAIADRITELFEVRDRDVASVAPRRRIYALAFEGWLRRPILGWGAGAFPLVYPFSPDGGYWIANITLHILFDSGIVGLLLVATAVSVAGWRALSTILYPPSRWNAVSYVTFGLLCAGLGLLAAFQITDGTWLGFVWVLLGMLVAAGRPKRERMIDDRNRAIPNLP